MTIPSKHISFNTLLDLADQRLKSADDVAAHLSGCAQCADELRRLEGFVTLMKADKSVDAPRDVLDYALKIFRLRGATSEPSLVERIVAALSFDSFNRAPAFGVRSGPDAARQLLYTAGESDIDLRISEQENNRWVIAGQLLGEDCAGGEVTLHGHEVTTSAYLNEQCEFALPAVPAGSYRLLLRLPNLEVEVPRLEIGV